MNPYYKYFGKCLGGHKQFLDPQWSLWHSTATRLTKPLYRIQKFDNAILLFYLFKDMVGVRLYDI